MKFLDLFAGIGGFRLGMEQAGHECVGYVEFDKYARKSYEAMHNIEGEWTAHDITRVTDDDIRQLGDRGQIDCICGGFPCQSFSIAGQRGGFDDTRGTLFFEIVRFASILRPQYLFLENVKGLINHDGGDTFETILRALDELGYDAEWDLCNSKDFGVPQNRERVFIVGHLRNGRGRKVFPVGRNNQAADIDVIGTTKKRQDSIGQREAVYSSDGSIGALTATDYKQPKRIIEMGRLDIKANDQNKRVYDSEGLSPTPTTMQGGGQEPKVVINPLQGKTKYGWHFEQEVYDANGLSRAVKAGGGSGNIPKVLEPMKIRENTKKGYVEAIAWDGIRLDHPNGTTGRGRTQKQLSPTLTTSQNAGTLTDDFRIRKLTPKECFRLQGFPDKYFHKAQLVNSDTQLYKQAGNSVTVNVICEIAKKLEVIS